MTIAEFEEKEFEGPINTQLSLGSPLWSPGQVLERLVGFDAAIHVVIATFWASLGFGSVPLGLPVTAAWWSGWPALLLRPLFALRSPPPFRLNVFLQYKRPEYLVHGQEWKHWRVPYFRFDVTLHQQRSLEACARSLGGGGLVAYGSPTFYRRGELFLHVEQRSLVDNTHFAPVTALAGHRRYSYTSARAAGKAHSEPVDVEPISFAAHADGEPPRGPPDGPPHIPGGGGGGPDAPTPEVLFRAAKIATRAATEASPQIVGSIERLDAAIERARRLIGQGLLRGAEGEAIDAFLRATLFAHMSGVQWLVAP